jgi:DNA-binding CsgD family transcriptional regulator
MVGRMTSGGSCGRRSAAWSSTPLVGGLPRFDPDRVDPDWRLAATEPRAIAMRLRAALLPFPLGTGLRGRPGCRHVWRSFVAQLLYSYSRLTYTPIMDHITPLNHEADREHIGPVGYRMSQTRLSPRERRVVELTECGWTEEAICQELHISPHTLRLHLKEIERKKAAD